MTADLNKTRRGRTRRMVGAASALAIGVGALGLVAKADPMLTTSRNTYGMPGLIDMPTAEVFPDANFSITPTHIGAGTQRNNLVFQIAPRLTGAFRYSRVPGLFLNEDSGDWTALYDRSFDLHFAFWDEGKYAPALAIGLRDFIGTGVYSGEYIVATKSLTDKLRATAGVGWGRLGSFGGRSGWGERPTYDTASTGGKFNSSQWFKGDYAPFFGLSYKLNDQWTLKGEYSSDAYAKETELDGFDRKSAFNFGVDYAPNPYVNLQAFYLYGTEIGLQATINLNPKSPPFPSGVETAPLPVQPRPAPAADPEGWSGAWASDPTAQPAIQKALADALRKEGQTLESMSLTATSADLRIRNTRYIALPEAMGRIARIATRALPPSVETITITPLAQGMALSSVTFKRTELEKRENTNSYAMFDKTAITAGQGDAAQVMTPGVYPKLTWSLGPYTAISLFDPSQPFRMDIGAALSARYEVAPGLILSGSVRKKAFGDIGSDRKVSTSSDVPQVRTDSALYSKEEAPTIHRLKADYYAKASDSVYAHVSAGLLERMYGGVSAEVLWQPVDSRLGLGLQASWVKKRGYDQRFDFQDYSTTTGFASAYYDFGKGYKAELDVGRYLAKDWGATLTLNRTFANGWKVGAFATVTDMSTEDFGEGSFDKGITFSIPLNWALGTPSQNTVDARIKPLTKDGGATLNLDGQLYDMVEPAQTGEIYNSWGRFWR